MLNIVVPMAGRGSRFLNAGYKNPKPLISIYGHPMIAYVTKNIMPRQEHRFIYICLQEHLERYHLEKTLKEMAPGCEVIPVGDVTQGAACTVLLAEKYINNEQPLMIANSDQYIDMDMNDYLAHLGQAQGLIMTMPAEHPKWSYIQYDENHWVTMVREKEVISHEATTGIYNFRHGADFVKYAKQMIDKNIRVQGEFYVAPVYNEMIADGMKIGFCDVGENMYGLGTPEDLNCFQETELSKNVFSEQKQEPGKG